MAGSDFSIDFAAAAPQIYDRDTGGGAFEDKTINVDAVESLEGGDFAVGDIVSYYFNVVTAPNAVDRFPQTIEVDVSFLVNTTGQTGVSHRDIVGVSANYWTGEFDSSGEIDIIEDTALIDDDSTIAWIAPGTEKYENKVTGEIYGDVDADYNIAAVDQGSVVSASVRINDLEPGEEVVLRVDTLLSAVAGTTPTGNLQGFVTGARVISPTDDPIINLGNQTIPFKLTKEISGIPELAPGLSVEKVVTTDLSGLTGLFDTNGDPTNTTDLEDADVYFDSIKNESSTVLEGETIRYVYKIENTGNVQVDNIFLQDDNGTPGISTDDFYLFHSDKGKSIDWNIRNTNGKNNDLVGEINGDFRIVTSGFINDSDNSDNTLSGLEDNVIDNKDDPRSLSPGKIVYVYYDAEVLDLTRSSNPTSLTNIGTVTSYVSPNNGGQQGDPITDEDTANIKILDNSSASLSGFTYLDLDNDGVKDANEPGIAGALMTITNINDSSDTYSVRTDLNGEYLFTRVTDPNTGSIIYPGLTGGATYTITQTQPSNYFDGIDKEGTGGGTPATTAGSNEISGVTVANGNFYQNYNFGEILPASISGVAYIDSIDDNNTPNTTSDDSIGSDGDRQDTETGRKGITVTLTGNNDFGQAVTLTSTTDSSGRYYFGDLRPSDSSGYTVKFGDGTDLGVVSDVSNSNFDDIGSVTQFDGTVSANLGSAGANNDPNTADTITGIILGAGANGTNYDFGLPASNVGGVISGTVYEDTGIYTNGVLDETKADDGLITDNDSSVTSTTPATGEKRISGVTIQLYDSSNNLVATTTTDINGNYSFTNLADDTYEVREIQPKYFDPSAKNGEGDLVAYLDGKETKNNDYINTASADTSDTLDTDGEGYSTISNLTISGSNNLIGNNFAELSPGSISGYVFLDLLNTETFGLNDGQSLTNSDTSTPLQDTSGNNVSNTSGDAETYLVNVRNGEFDDDEFGLAGITIQLSGTDDEGTSVSLTTTTDANGYYRFDSLRPSNAAGYTVTQVQPTDYNDGIYDFNNDLSYSRTEVLTGNILGLPEGQYNDTGTGNDSFSSINLAFGQSGVDYNFPEATSNGLITGTVYDDVDKDGDGDSPLAGVTIELLNSSDNSVVATTTTNSNGVYAFTNVDPNVNAGNYLIRETDPGGYESVSDGDSIDDGGDDAETNNGSTNDNLLSVNITAGEIDSGNDFVDQTKDTISGTGASESLTGTSADEVFIGGAGRDTLEAGVNGGNDCFKFNYTSDGVDTINNFSSGDIIDFSSFFDTGGELEGKTNPFGTYVETISIGGGTMIQIDFDPSDSLPNKNVVFLEGYTTTMAAADFAF